MTRAIESVQMWKCSVTGKVFDNAKEAEKHSKDAQARLTRKRKAEEKEQERLNLIKYQEDYVRLNATSFDEIFQLVVAKAKEFWGGEVEVEPGNVAFTENHDDKGPSWRFNIKVRGQAIQKEQLKVLRDLGLRHGSFNGQPYLRDTLFKGLFNSCGCVGFRGIHANGVAGRVLEMRPGRRCPLGCG